MSDSVDYLVIGGGIVGLSVAVELLRSRPGASLMLVEKEDRIAAHQTGHNSGVIHSGIYYAPGSLKARLCRQGSVETKRFAAENGIAVDVCGKLIVASDERELAAMRNLAERAGENGIVTELLDAAEVTRREPAIRGLGAILVPETGIIDYGLVSRRFAEIIVELGGQILLNTEVTAIREDAGRVTVETDGGEWEADQVVACAGLQADRLARMAGLDPDFRIVPFRGEYFKVGNDRRDLISHLIYPVPDPEVPFLGVHLTRTVDGGITVGPNAVLGLSREGYRKFSISPKDVWDFATFPGMWKVAKSNFVTGAREVTDSVFKRAYLDRCRKYCPELTMRDLTPAPAGIRAQAVLRDGSLVHDFLFRRSLRILHVANAPSPAATSAIPIGREIVQRLVAEQRR